MHLNTAFEPQVEATLDAALTMTSDVALVQARACRTAGGQSPSPVLVTRGLKSEEIQ